MRESSEEGALQCQPAQKPQISGVIVTSVHPGGPHACVPAVYDFVVLVAGAVLTEWAESAIDCGDRAISKLAGDKVTTLEGLAARWLQWRNARLRGLCRGPDSAGQPAQASANVHSKCT